MSLNVRGVTADKEPAGKGERASLPKSVLDAFDSAMVQQKLFPDRIIRKGF